MAIADKDQQLSHLQKIVQELRPPLSQSQVVEEQHQRQVSSEVQRSQRAGAERLEGVACGVPGLEGSL